MLGAARRLDEALGLDEVVASGFAFERDGLSDEFRAVAVDRALEALLAVDVRSVLVPTKQRRSATDRRRIAIASILCAVGLGFGAVDRIVVETALHPLTTREASAAAKLERTAETASKAAAEPEAKQLVDAARRASAAAQRGDRARAREAIEDMRRAERALSSQDRDRAQALRSLREELEAGLGPSSGERSGDNAGAAPPSSSAGEALARMRKTLDSPGASDTKALQALAERLQKAEAAARAAAEREGASGERGSGRPSEGRRSAATAWSEAAAAMREAREAAARGDPEAAKRALERAERAVSSIEKAHAAASSRAMAQLRDQASALDRSMFDALRGAGSKPGREDGDADGDGDGSKMGENGTDGSSKGKNRSSDSADDAPPTGVPGDGPGRNGHPNGPEQRRLKIDGDLQARADVGRGERVVSAIEGVGRGGDPRAFREVFPAYDTVVEDGLREELVPAARRPAVRRYFSLIRPDVAPEDRK
jgi:hypothetical protein